MWVSSPLLHTHQLNVPCVFQNKERSELRNPWDIKGCISSIELLYFTKLFSRPYTSWLTYIRDSDSTPMDCFKHPFSDQKYNVRTPYSMHREQRTFIKLSSSPTCGETKMLFDAPTVHTYPQRKGLLKRQIVQTPNHKSPLVIFITAPLPPIDPLSHRFWNKPQSLTWRSGNIPFIMNWKFRTPKLIQPEVFVPFFENFWFPTHRVLHGRFMVSSILHPYQGGMSHAWHETWRPLCVMCMCAVMVLSPASYASPSCQALRSDLRSAFPVMVVIMTTHGDDWFYPFKNDWGPELPHQAHYA